VSILINIAVILGTSAIIYFVGQRFVEASSRVGDYFNLPRSVKGATFDAISSSFPELMIALFSVVAFQRFEMGIGTITGSALMNLLVITGICVLVAPKAFKVRPKVIRRDGWFYVLSVLVLFGALLWSKNWGLPIPLVFIGFYGFYLGKIFWDVHVHRRTVKQDKKTREISLPHELFIGLSAMIAIGVASYFLTEHCIVFAEGIGIPPLLIAFTVMAIATSLSDAVISITNARKGHFDDAISNVFGSNVFDIFIGIGLPALVAVFLVGGAEITFGNTEVVFGLLAATILVIYFFTQNRTLKKKHGIYMLLIYAGFLVYMTGVTT